MTAIDLEEVQLIISNIIKQEKQRLDDGELLAFSIYRKLTELKELELLFLPYKIDRLYPSQYFSQDKNIHYYIKARKNKLYELLALLPPYLVEMQTSNKDNKLVIQTDDTELIIFFSTLDDSFVTRKIFSDGDYSNISG